MATTLLSSDQCIKQAFNQDKQSLDVTVKDLAIGITLNHEQDSITAISKSVCKEAKANEAADVSGFRQLSIYAAPGSVVKASPSLDKEVWANVGIVPPSGVLTLNICAIRIVVSNDCHVVGV